MTTELAIQSQFTAIQTDIRATLQEFFETLPEMESYINIGRSELARSSAIKVTDGESFTAASESVKAIDVAHDGIEDLMKPFIDRLFKVHRTATAIRKDFLQPLEAEITRLKRELETYNTEQTRLRQQEEHRRNEAARKAEEERLLKLAAQRDAEGDTEEAELLLADAEAVIVAPVILPSTTPKLEGVSFRSDWKWELCDIARLKPEFLLPNEKTISALVRSSHQAAESIVGAGAIKTIEKKIVVDR